MALEGFAIVPRAMLADSRLNSTDIRVYLALSSRANGSLECWPSHATIAEDVGRDKRTVIRTLERLRELGYISWSRRVREDGSLTSNIYRLGGPDEPVGGDKNDRGGSAKDDSTPLSRMSQQERYPLNENQKELPPTPASGDVDEAFERAWKAWPRPESKKNALAKFRRLVRDRRFTVDDLAETIIRFGHAYAATRPDRSKVPYLVTWLNGERWDDPIPSAAESLTVEDILSQPEVSW